jgi:hypothetical protein
MFDCKMFKNLKIPNISNCIEKKITVENNKISKYIYCRLYSSSSLFYKFPAPHRRTKHMWGSAFL